MQRAFFAVVALCAFPLAVLAQPQPAAAIWQMQNSGTTAGLRGIFSVDGNVAWASGTGGTVLRTTDGGAHWQHCATPDAEKDGATLDFRGVQAWDADTAIVMASGPGDKSRLYKTSDGCKTWVLTFTNPDAPNGFWDAFSIHGKSINVLGDPVDGAFVLEVSSDGGATWEREKLPPILGKEGAFAASNTSLFVEWEDGISLFGTGGEDGSRIFVMCDPCTGKPFDRDAWSVKMVPGFARKSSSGIFSIAAEERTPVVKYVAVGGDYSRPDRQGVAVYSRKWMHWTASEKPPHGYRSTVQWSEAEKAWFTAGTNGSDISRDDGRTWQPLDDGNWNALSLPFIVGPNGRIAKLNPSALPKP